MNGGDIDLNNKVFDGAIQDDRGILLEKLTGVLFKKIDFDNESLQTLKKHSSEEHIVYATFHSSNISLLILYNLLKKYKFKLPRLALEYNPFCLQTAGYIWKRIIKSFKKKILRKPGDFIFDSDYTENLMRSGSSIIVSLLSRKFFLKRYMEIKYDSLIYLIELQKKFDEPIYIFPQMIFWNMNPERTKSFISSKATGDRGLLTGWFTTIKSITPAFIRVSSPLNLREEIAGLETDDLEKQAIDIRNRLLEMYHHEKRTVLGPVIKSRQEMMEKVLYHKDVLDRIEKLAKREKVPVRKMRKRAYGCFKEIAADFSILIVKFFSHSLKFVFNRMFDGISYDPDSIRRIRESAKKGPLILVPSHKSHMDYLIISHLFYENKLIPPHIAAGINLSFFPAGVLFRHSGAFFIRRSFIGQKLYTVVFKQYIRTLIAEGYSIEFFMEGGRSRTGKLILPQVGFLYFLIEAIKSGYNNDLVFVPISINYDRILEEKAHMKELKGDEKQVESVRNVVKGRKLLRKKYGKVYVSFNEAITLQEISESVADEKRLPAEIASKIFVRINEVTVVTSFALVTSAILMVSERGFSGETLKEIVIKLFDYLVYSNARMSDVLLDRSNLCEITENVIQTYLQDRILEQIKLDIKDEEDSIEDFYVLKDDNRSRIGFYKNNIIHYFVPVAFVSLVILNNNREGRALLMDVEKEYEFIKEFFSREFVYSDADSDTGRTIEYLYNDSVLTGTDDGVISIDKQRLNDIKLYAKMIKDQLESYYIVLKTLTGLKEKRIKRNRLIVTIRKTGYRMYHIGEIDLAESLSVPNYNNAVDKFSSAGILKGGDRLREKVEVEIVDIDKAKEFQEKIRGYLNILTVHAGGD